jgi:ATP-binding cassette subfamily B protein
MAYRKETLLALLLMLVAKLSIVLIPLVLKHIVDELGRPLAHALFPAFLVLAYALLRLLGDALNEARDVVFSPVAQRTVAAFTERTFAHLHRMSARFHTRRETGAIVRDVQKGADGIGYFVRRRIVHIVPTALEIAAIIAIMVRNYAREFTLAIAVTFMCYAVYTFVFTRRRVAFQRTVMRLRRSPMGGLSTVC